MAEVNGAEQLRVGDAVLVHGLVNAAHLNGQRGVVSSEASGKEGRVGVRFGDEGGGGKAIKPSNLEFLYEYTGEDGCVDRVMRNAVEQQCEECQGDLRVLPHVCKDSTWLCEEHYAERHAPAQAVRCLVCRGFLPLRVPRHKIKKKFVESWYPERLLPGGRRVVCDKKGASWACEGCFRCHYCAIPFQHGIDFPGEFIVTMVEGAVGHGGGLLEGVSPRLFCKRKEGLATEHRCTEGFKRQQKALKRLRQIEALSTEEMQELLEERGVEWEGAARRDLVQMVVVTDKKKGERTGHVVTHHTPAGEKVETFVEMRAAPGVDLLDARCHHGAMFVWDKKKAGFHQDLQELQNSWYDAPIMNMQMQNDISKVVDTPIGRMTIWQVASIQCMQFWLRGQDVLRTDKRRFIQKQMWAGAVVPKQIGFPGFSRSNAATSLIVGALCTELESKNRLLTEEEAADLLQSRPLQDYLQRLAQDEAELYSVLNCEELRVCDCMQYIACAAKIGAYQLGRAKHKVKEVVRCAECETHLTKPNVCDACHEVAYCNSQCQKKHWKQHKAECKRKK